MRILKTDVGNIIIREAMETDAKEIIEFMNWVVGEVEFHTFGINDFNIKAEDESKMINIFRINLNCLFLVALYKNEIIGIATLAGGLKERVEHRATVGISVSKKYWRLGIGENMMDIIINYSKNSDIITKIELLVHEDNTPAIRLYEKLNFFKEGAIKRYFLVNNEYHDGINMGLIVKK